MSVIAAGNFDGVHLGHRDVLRRAAALGVERNTEALAVTFFPHPRTLLTKTPVRLLSDTQEKCEKIKACGISKVIVLDFDSIRAAQSPTEFLRELRTRFDCTDLVCGENFRFGRQAAGRFAFSGERLEGITGHIVPALSWISSSAIRNALEQGDVKMAAEMLGEPYTLTGAVAEGRHIGRVIGFPTLNFWPAPDRVLPRNGVYITEARFSGKTYPAMTNVGCRPTVETAGAVNVETYLLFDPKLPTAPAEIRVSFLAALRGESTFSSVAELQAQLLRDRRCAEDFFEKK